MTKPKRCILVTPSWCLTSMTGGGQRTALFYAALKRLGPTEVVVVGHGLDRDKIAAAFEDGVTLHLVETDRVPHRPMKGLELQLDRFRRYIWFSREYRPEPALQDHMQSLLAEDAAGTVILYRYFPPFCWAGHTDQPQRSGDLRRYRRPRRPANSSGASQGDSQPGPVQPVLQDRSRCAAAADETAADPGLACLVRCR